MLRFLAFLIFAAVAAGFGWQYAPENIRDGAARFLGIAQDRGERQVKKFREDVVLPEDPRERRKILTEELRKNIEEIKRREGLTASAPDVELDPARNKATLEELIVASEEALKELGAANTGESFGAKVTDKILDAIFSDSSPQAPCECGKVE